MGFAPIKWTCTAFFWPRQLTDRAILAIRQTREKKIGGIQSWSSREFQSGIRSVLEFRRIRVKSSIGKEIMWNFLKETNSRLGDHPRRPTKTNSRLDHDWETWDFVVRGDKKPGGAWQNGLMTKNGRSLHWCAVTWQVTRPSLLPVVDQWVTSLTFSRMRRVTLQSLLKCSAITFLWDD